MTREQLLSAGWRVSSVSLYEREGLEGWRWDGPGGEEYWEVGPWDEPPPVPADLEALPCPPDDGG